MSYLMLHFTLLIFWLIPQGYFIHSPANETMFSAEIIQFFFISPTFFQITLKQKFDEEKF